MLVPHDARGSSVNSTNRAERIVREANDGVVVTGALDGGTA